MVVAVTHPARATPGPRDSSRPRACGTRATRCATAASRAPATTLRGDRLDVGGGDFLAAVRGAHRRADLARQRDRPADQRRRDLPGLPRDAPRRASETINLLTYVYWQGDIAHEVADALCERARAGVEVNVLLDWVGTAQMDTALVDRDERRGRDRLQVPPAAPVDASGGSATAPTARSLVVDGCVGLIGGVGIAEEWTGDADDPDHWRDTHVRVRGPVVRGLQGAFAENWLEATGDVLVGPTYLPASSRSTAGRRCRSSARPPAWATPTPRRCTSSRSRARERSIDLTAAYFAPRPAFVHALRDAAERGVDVRVLVPGPHIDKEFVRIAGPPRPTPSCSTAACGSSSTSRRCSTPRRSSSTARGRASAR